MPDLLWEFVQRLPWYDPRRILVTAIQPFRTQVPIVVDDKINPMLVVRAQEGYWLQSRVQRIPDRYGFFVSGPPLLQAHDARKAIISTTDGVSPVVGFCVSEAFGVIDTQWRLSLALVVITFLFLISVYVGEIFYNPMRLTPDYDWEALGKKRGLVWSHEVALAHSAPASKSTEPPV